VFDNTNKDCSPQGYETDNQISVSRSIENNKVKCYI
jgi:hypothetical protein